MYSNPYVGGQLQDYQQQHSQGYGQPFVQNTQFHQQQYSQHYPASIKPQQSGPVHGQQQAQSCFNCGSIEHWAQHCPEPRRAIPVGSVSKQVPPVNTQIPAMPLTVQKTGGPTITRYPPPPGYHQQYGQHASLNGPLTPMSAYPQSYGQQWPQGSQNQYSPMSSQSSPYAPYGYPTPVTPYGSQYSSPASARSQPYQNGFLPQRGQYQQHYGPQQAPNPQCYQGQMNSPQNPNPSHTSPAMPQQPQQPYSFYGSNQPAPSAGTPHSTQGNGAHGAQDYSAWGFSQNNTQMTEPVRGEITWLAPKPVGRPLSATFSQSEAQESLVPPWSEESGNSVSKYFNLKSFSEACVTIRDAEDWIYMKDDPVFRHIGDNGDLIPISELLASWGRCRRRGDGADQNESRKLSIPSDHGGNQSDQPGWSVMDNLENALNSGDFTAVSNKQTQVKSEPFDMAEMEQLDMAEEFTQRKLSQDLATKQEKKTSITSGESQEEKLARLGVTGTPKPIISRVPSQSMDRGGSRRRSRSPTYDRQLSSDSCLSNNRHQSYRERDALRPHVEKLSLSRQNSHGSGDNLAGSARANDRHSSQQHGYTHTCGINAVPPPPPPPPMHTCYRGVDNCSPSSSHENLHLASRGSSEALNDNQPINRGRRSASPSGSRSKSLSGSGREYRERDRLSERKDEPQRQPDDLAVKRKRSQPHVADAYR